jgi:hypothetical protein
MQPVQSTSGAMLPANLWSSDARKRIPALRQQVANITPDRSDANAEPVQTFGKQTVDLLELLMSTMQQQHDAIRQLQADVAALQAPGLNRLA